MPTIKVSSNSEIAAKKPHWIDFNAGALLDGTKTMAQLEDDLFALILAVASGEQARRTTRRTAIARSRSGRKESRCRWTPGPGCLATSSRRLRGADASRRSADSATLELPEKVVQFGTGAFLRGFARILRRRGKPPRMFNGSIVAVSSTGSSRDARAERTGRPVTRSPFRASTARQPSRRYRRSSSSLSRAISARDEWDAVLALARDPRIELVISNTTEVGIALDSADAFADSPPRSFPAKLTRFLAERAVAFDY